MIIYFSGTGNTRKCARELGELLGEECTELTARELRHPEEARFATDDRNVIWMFPTYSWGIPPVVREVMRKGEVKAEAGSVHWMVTTCGDDIGNTAKEWRREMKRRGYRAAGSFSVQMPNTYTFMKGFDVDSDELADKKIRESAARIAEIAGKIAEGGERCAGDDVVRGKWAWAKTAIVRPWFERHCMSPKPFAASDACTSCGLCMRSCPMENIEPGADNKPKWGEACALCERCYHICPAHAVTYGKTTEGKGQYRQLITCGR